MRNISLVRALCALLASFFAFQVQAVGRYCNGEGHGPSPAGIEIHDNNDSLRGMASMIAARRFYTLRHYMAKKLREQYGVEIEGIEGEARTRFFEAYYTVVRDLKRGSLRLPGLEPDRRILGGFDAIKWRFVKDLKSKKTGEDILGQVEWDDVPHLKDVIQNVTITVDMQGAANKDQVFQTIGHELRHLTKENDIKAKRSHEEGEKDAEIWGDLLRDRYAK